LSCTSHSPNRGGGIASLCLAGALAQLDPTGDHIQVDVYESSPQFSEIGAGVTLWGRVCEALHIMNLAEPCINQAVVAASSSELHASGQGFALRESTEPHHLHGFLPFKDAWSLHRADLLQILLRRVPRERTHLNKRVTHYQCSYSDPEAPITLFFADGTFTQCDVLIGADGLRSPIRGQLMRDAAAAKYIPSGAKHPIPYHRYIQPRHSGTTAYRSLVDAAALRKRNPKHPLLQMGQVYLCQSKHIVGYPISPTVINIAVNVTSSGVPFRTPGSSPISRTDPSLLDRSRNLNREAYRADVLPLFSDCHSQCIDLLEAVDSSIEWPIMDLEPLPFYARGRVAIMGDAAHATVPYMGAGAAFAMEDAFILSRALYAAATSRSSSPRRLEHALGAYQAIRLPYGNRLIGYGRRALRDFQLSGPFGADMSRTVASLIDAFNQCAAAGDSGPGADAVRVVELFRHRMWMAES